MSDDAQDRPPEEQQIIDEIAETHGREWAEEHEELILKQAQYVGAVADRRAKLDAENE